MEYPIRVLILDTVMDRGGAEATTMNYYRNMDRSKIQFDFLVHRDYKAAYEDEITQLGGRIYRICPPYPQNYFKYRKFLRNLLKEHPEYKIIHCNMMELGLFAYMEAKKSKVPVRICHAHTTGGQQTKMSLKKAIYYSLIRDNYKKLMHKFITHKFACGEDAAKWVFKADDTSDVIIMRNAIDSEKFTYNLQIDKKIRDEFDLHGKFVVGHVGRFFEPKNHPFIIDIFYEISKKDDDAVLVLVGAGEIDPINFTETKAKVERLGLSDKVIFTGLRTDVNEVMQAFDVFILPSLTEGLPVVMVEAQAAGLKCVISNNVPIECDITGNVEVLSLEDGAETWAQAVCAYKSTYKKKNMRQRIVEENYDIKANAMWLEEFYIREFNGNS